jgi:hypothetical protein
MRTLAVIATVLALSACEKDVPRSQMPHLADFCMHQSNWPELLKAMGQVAARHGMELHGGIEKDPKGKPLFNAYIARGYSFWFGDDLDLWIVGNPFEGGDMAFNGISKRPWKQSDTEIAREIMTGAAQLRCERKATQTPR